MTYHRTMYLNIFEGTRGQPTSWCTPSHIDGSTLVPTTGLGPAKQDSTVQLYYQHGLADSTHPDMHFKHSESFARRSLYTIPSWSQKCCRVISQQGQLSRIQTVKTYLAAVRNLQISLDLPDLQDQCFLPMLKQVQARIYQIQAMKVSKRL